MTWIGDYRYGETIDFKFTTRQFSTGAPAALTGGQLSCYKDNSATQDSGAISLTASFDSITGLNHVSIDTDDTGADSSTFYTDSGTVYDVVINTGTVDSVSVVGEVVGRFRLGYRPYVDAVWEALDTGLADTGTMGRLRQGVNVKKVVGDTGAATNILQAFLDTGVVTANVHKIFGDTGAASNLLQAVLDTGVITANMHKVFGDTGAAANILQRYLDTGGVRVVDTGAIANVVWGKDVRALTAFGFDTGIWGSNFVGGRQLTSFAFDTGIWESNYSGGRQLTSFGFDTGVRDTVWKTNASDYDSDTGRIAYTAANVNINRIAGDTGAPTRIDRAGRTEVLGTCTTGGNTTTVIASALSPTSAVNDQFNGRILIFDKDTTTAALRGQATDITDYVHATLTFTVTALTTSPASGDSFVVV